MFQKEENSIVLVLNASGLTEERSPKTFEKLLEFTYKKAKKSFKEMKGKKKLRINRKKEISNLEVIKS